MKTLSFIMFSFFLCHAAKAQTPISQSKQDTPVVTGSVVVSQQALPLSETSKPAPKQIIVTNNVPEKTIVTLTSAAQPLDANSMPAEKKVVVTGVEPVQTETKLVNSGAVEEKKD
jgi:hypothetical protein